MKPRVFIVEDDEGLRELLSTLAGTAGFEVTAFESAEEFLAAYDPAQAGCLVLDIGLPGLSGLDLLKRLSAQKAKLPVIMISGSGEATSITAQATKLGAADFFEKPFDVYVLLNRIQQVMGRGKRIKPPQA